MVKANTGLLKPCFLLAAMALAACGQDEPAEPAPPPREAEVKALSSMDAEALAQLLPLRTKAEIQAALPPALQNPEDTERVMAWHREAFGRIVSQPVQQAAEGLKQTDLLQIFEKLEDLDSQEEFNWAEADLTRARHALEEAENLMMERAVEEQEKLAELLGGYQFATALMPRMVVTEYAGHEIACLKLQMQMLGHLLDMMKALRQRSEGTFGLDQKAALLKHSTAFSRTFSQYQEIRERGPKGLQERREDEV